MPAAAALDPLIALCYEAAHDSSAWGRFISAFCIAMDADVGAVYIAPIDGYTSSLFVIHNSAPLERVIDMLPQYGHVAPFIERAIAKGLAPGVFRITEVTDPEGADRDRYETYMRHAGVQAVLQILLQRGDDPNAGPPICVGIGRLWGKPDFSDEERDFAAALFPHLRRAARLSLHAASAPHFDPAIAQAFDQFATPCILLRMDKRVVFANQAAHEFAARESVLKLSNEALQCSEPSVANMFREAIDDAVGFDWSLAGRNGAEIALPTAGAATIALIVPLGPDNPFVGWIGPVRAAIYLLDAGAPRTSLAGLQRVRTFFGLTTTEAEIAAGLIAGKSPETIAAERSVEVSTVRQHIKAVMLKTDTHRQAELSKLRPLLEGPR